MVIFERLLQVQVDSAYRDLCNFAKIFSGMDEWTNGEYIQSHLNVKRSTCWTVCTENNEAQWRNDCLVSRDSCHRTRIESDERRRKKAKRHILSLNFLFTFHILWSSLHVSHKKWRRTMANDTAVGSVFHCFCFISVCSFILSLMYYPVNIFTHYLELLYSALKCPKLHVNL